MTLVPISMIEVSAIPLPCPILVFILGFHIEDRSLGVCGVVVIVQANGDSNWQVNEGLRALALNENSTQLVCYRVQWCQ